jgi:hypothetical protein
MNASFRLKRATAFFIILRVSSLPRSSNSSAWYCCQTAGRNACM